MALHRIEAIVATNAPIDVYGGIQIPNSMLEKLASEIRSGRLRFSYNHDASHIIEVLNADASVEMSEAGARQVRASFDVEAADARFLQEQFARAGVQGGMSWSFAANPRHAGSGGVGSGGVTICADAGFFEPDRLLALAQPLADFDGVDVCELYQFGALPPALVVIEIAGDREFWVSFVSGGASSLAATALWALCSKLLRPRHRHQTDVVADLTAIDIKVTTAGVVHEYFIRTGDADHLKLALDELGPAARAPLPKQVFDPERSEWVPPP